MASDPQYKSIRVGLETHRRLHDLAAQINGSADDAIAFMLGMSAVRVPVTETQRERWQAAADHAGMKLSAFIAARVEGALAYGGDPYGLQLVYEHVSALTRAAGVEPIPVTPRPPQSTPGAHP